MRDPSPAQEPRVVDDLPSPPRDGMNPAVALPTDGKSDRAGLAALFRSEESGLLRFGIGLVGRRTVAEELVQEIFLRLHQAWGDVDNPKAWLYRSLRNLALNHLRDRPKETPLPEELAAGDDPLPPELLGRNEAVGTVRSFLAEMPPEDRNLIRLKYHDGLKYREISRRTGLSVGNVGYRLHHLLKGLADSLRSCGIEGSQG